MLKKVDRSLGFANSYRIFISGYFQIAVFLIILIGKNTTFE